MMVVVVLCGVDDLIAFIVVVLVVYD